jgi:hypothetical protein
MKPVVDITDDRSKTTYLALTNVVDLPDYVKEAAVDSPESVENLPGSAFADSINRKFPLNTKASTWVSALYLHGANTEAPQSIVGSAETKLNKMAEVWGISEDIELVKQALAKAETPVEYAIDFEWRGTSVQRCPFHTPELAVKSAEWLATNYQHFPIEVLKTAAERLTIACNEATLPDAAEELLQKLSHTQEFSNLNVKVANAIIDRLERTKHLETSEMGMELKKLASTLLEDPLDLVGQADLVAECLEAFDVEKGFHQKWGADFSHPVDVCFNITFEKAAAATNFVELTTGSGYDLSSLTNRQLEYGLKYAGDDMLDYCKPDGLNLDRAKVAEILPTMPAPDAKNFSLGIQKAGGIQVTLNSVLEAL